MNLPGQEPFPAVSIATITHNRPRLLELLAQCVIAQVYPPERLEWVVIDDSSCGPEPDLSAVAQAGIALVYRRLEQRLPIGAKRNLCHQVASGELLVLMDDDDYYPPTRVEEAVAGLAAADAQVAGCVRMPLLLLPEGSRWLTPSFCANDATANSLAYRRSYVEAGHGFDPQAEQAEEVSFLEQFTTRLVPLDPVRSLTCIGHGGNTVDKRLWIARNGQHRFERLPADAPGFPPGPYLQRYCEVLGLPAWRPAASNVKPPEPWRVAVITPYHNEPLDLLRRCHASVQAQTTACTHVLVADGPGHQELNSWDCRHIVLGVGHGDNGNTPRSIGALAAMNEGFNCIAFLDADNWWAPEHLSASIATQAEGNYHVVFSDRHIVFPNGMRLTQPPVEDRTHRHADTSCMVLFEPAFSSLALWAQMPRLLAPQCDRVMFSHLMASQPCGWSGQATAVFETWYAGHFLAAGLLPPSNAKFLELRPASAWDQAAVDFRRRSPTPIYPGAEGVGPEKPRINLVTILGGPCSGGTLLQAGLCRHLGFAGIPENQFLFHCIARMGPDHRLRHSGEQLRQKLAEASPPETRLKAFDLQGRGLERALNPERSYTVLEAYFRAVQALLPADVLAFSRAYGQVHVLDRSCSLALVADVLFRCLPEHRAVLMLRDPLEQIAALRRRMVSYPEVWAFADGSLTGLCRVVLESLAVPLQAAPPGQLQLVSYRRLRKEPQAVLEAVYGVFETAPNPFFGLEPFELGPEPVHNLVHEHAYAALLEDLPNQLVLEEERRWKHACLAAGLLSPDQVEENPAERFSPAEWEELKLLLAPLQMLIGALETEEPIPVVDLSKVKGDSELVHLVEQVVEELNRHACWRRKS